MEQPLEVGYPHFIISCSCLNQESVFIDGGFNIRSEHHRCPERFTVVRWQFRDFG
jgi:hypothetical protein